MKKLGISYISSGSYHGSGIDSHLCISGSSSWVNVPGIRLAKIETERIQEWTDRLNQFCETLGIKFKSEPRLVSGRYTFLRS
jgi:hypothetical protein